MTEAEWLTCTEPRRMLKFLKDGAGDRKPKLFAAAAFRRLEHLLPDSGRRRGIAVLEQMAEGAATVAESNRAAMEVRRALGVSRVSPEDGRADDPYYVALMLYRAIVSSFASLTRTSRRRTVDGAASHAVHAADGVADFSAEREQQSRLLRDIFGSPFRPTSDVPAYVTSPVVVLASAMYEIGCFDRMPELADALQQAGCTDGGVLGHCREPGPHIRGCWVVDLILGKA